MSVLTQHHQVSLFSATSLDVDHLSEIVSPWNLHLHKLDKGSSFRGHFDLVVSDNIVVGKTDFSGVLHQTGAPPDGMRTFHVPVDDNQHLFWRNMTINRSSIGLFPKGGELDAITKPGFKLYVVSLNENELLSEANNLGLDSRSLWNNKGLELMVLNEQEIYTVRDLLSRFFLSHLLYLDQTTLDNYIQHLKKSWLSSKKHII